MMTLPESGPTKDASKNGQGDAHGETEQPSNATVSLAERVIERFGGIRPMASKLSVPVTTVQGWKKRGAIPPTRLNDLREAAKRYSIRLTEEELVSLAGGEDRGPEGITTGLSGLKPSPTVPIGGMGASAESGPETAAGAGNGPQSADGTGRPSTPLGEDAEQAARTAKLAQRPGEQKAIPPIETAAEIPPIEIPRFDIPPAEVPISSTANGKTEPRPAGNGDPRAAHPQDSSQGSTFEAGTVLPMNDGTAGAGQDGRSRFSTWTVVSLLAALLALLCAAIAIYVATSGNPIEPRSSGTPRDLERRVTEVESKVSRVALEQVAVQTALEQRINAVDGRIDDASERTAATAARLADQISDLKASTEEIEKKIVSMPMGSPTLAKILAASQLRSALEKPTPFQSELEAVRIAGISNPRVTQALQQIEKRATTGIATETWLTIRFPAFSEAIINASTAGDPIGQVMDGVSGLIEYYAPPLYRFAGYAGGETARAVVARAEQALRTGNFQNAIDELSRLDGAAAHEAEPWLAEARARLAANRVRTILNNHMIALAAAGPGSE